MTLLCLFLSERSRTIDTLVVLLFLGTLLSPVLALALASTPPGPVLGGGSSLTPRLVDPGCSLLLRLEHSLPQGEFDTYPLLR